VERLGQTVEHLSEFLSFFDPFAASVAFDETHFHTNVYLGAEFTDRALGVAEELDAVAVAVALIAFGDA